MPQAGVTSFDLALLLAALLVLGAVMYFLARRPGQAQQKQIQRLIDGAAKPQQVRNAPPNSVFISYRRADSGHAVDRLFERLVTALDPGTVFKDVESIPPGSDFRRHIRDSLGQCKVFVCVIGTAWEGTATDGTSRLDDPADFVRLEIETALERKIPFIPVFVDGVTGLGDRRLPDSLRDLPFLQAVPLRRDPDFNRDVTRIIEGISTLLTQPAG